MTYNALEQTISEYFTQSPEQDTGFKRGWCQTHTQSIHNAGPCNTVHHIPLLWAFLARSAPQPCSPAAPQPRYSCPEENIVFSYNDIDYVPNVESWHTCGKDICQLLTLSRRCLQSQYKGDSVPVLKNQSSQS